MTSPFCVVMFNNATLPTKHRQRCPERRIMKNIFSFKLYLQGLRKIRTAGIAMAVSIVALNAWIPIGRLLNERPTDITVEIGTFAPFGYLLVLFAPLLVYNMFSYLNERKASDFFHALPQKRICIYISFMAAVFTWIAAALFLSTLINAILWSAWGSYAVSLKAVMLTPLNFLLLAAVSAGFMALAMMLTGTAVSNVFVFLALFFFVRILGTCFASALSGLVPMFNLDYSALKVWDWWFFLPITLLELALGSYVEECQSAGFYLYWIAVAVALLAASAVAYCRRKSEIASKSAPNRFMHHAFRICMTVPFLIFAVYIHISENPIFISLLCVIGGLTVWILYELLTSKKLVSVLRSLPLLLIPAVIAGGYFGSVHLAKNIFYASTPEREEIESIKIEEPSSHWEPNAYYPGISGFSDAILFHSEIRDPKILDEVYEMLQKTKKNPKPLAQGFLGGFYDDAVITLTTSTGKKVTYNLHPYYSLDDTFFRSEEFLAHASAFDFDVVRIESELKREMITHVWEVFKEEFKALNDEQKRLYLHWNEQRALQGRDLFRVYGSYGGVEFCQSYTPIAEYTPNAYRIYMEYATGNAEANLEEFRSAVDQFERISLFKTNGVNLFVDNGGMDWVFRCNDMGVVYSFLHGLDIDSHLTDYENAPSDKIYRVTFSVTWKEEGEYRLIESETYLTFSDEDIARYQQLAEKAG